MADSEGEHGPASADAQDDLLTQYHQALAAAEALPVGLRVGAKRPTVVAPFSRWFLRYFMVSHVQHTLDVVARALRRRVITSSGDAEADGATADTYERFAEALPPIKHARLVAFGLLGLALMPIVIGQSLAVESGLLLELVSAAVSLDGVELARVSRDITPQTAFWALLPLIVAIVLAAVLPFFAFRLKRELFLQYGVYEAEVRASRAAETRCPSEGPIDLGVLIALFASATLFYGYLVLTFDSDFSEQLSYAWLPAIFFAVSIWVGVIGWRRVTPGWQGWRTITVIAIVVTGLGLYLWAGASGWAERTELTSARLSQVSIEEQVVLLGDVLDETGASLRSDNHYAAYLEDEGRGSTEADQLMLRGIAVSYEARLDGALYCSCAVRATVYDATTSSPLDGAHYESNWPLNLDPSDIHTSTGTVWALRPEDAGRYFVKVEVVVSDMVEDRSDVPAHREVEPFKIASGDEVLDEGLRYYVYRRLAAADTDVFEVVDAGP